MRTSVDGVRCRRDLPACAGNCRDRRDACCIHPGDLLDPGELRRCRTARTPKKEGVSLTAGTDNRASGRRLAMISRHWIVVIALLMLTGCAVGPNYKRPPVTVPGTYRGLAADTDPQATASLGDEKWWTVYQDEQLQALIREALAQNYDMRIAAARVLQAQAVLGITRADQFPTITGGASASGLRVPRTKTLPGFESSSNQVNLSLFWELDFWGKYRRATEAARAN